MREILRWGKGRPREKVKKGKTERGNQQKKGGPYGKKVGLNSKSYGGRHRSILGDFETKKKRIKSELKQKGVLCHQKKSDRSLEKPNEEYKVWGGEKKTPRAKRSSLRVDYLDLSCTEFA